MALPRIDASDDRIGFCWRTPQGAPARLGELMSLPGAEPERWLPTHLAALDDVLIDVAGRFGEVIGGGRRLEIAELPQATRAYREIDRLSHEYAQARRQTMPAEFAGSAGPAGLSDDVRAGKILGTGALVSIRLRHALGIMAPAPFDGELDSPETGVVGGHARFRWVSEDERWRGGRWLVETLEGRRLPATLSMLLFDSSGVEKDGALAEHRDALGVVTEAVASAEAEPMIASGAVDWLLFDWIMAHRESPDSAAVEIKSGRLDDARLIVDAAEASAAVRSTYDIGLLDLPA